MRLWDWITGRSKPNPTHQHEWSMWSIVEREPLPFPVSYVAGPIYDLQRRSCLRCGLTEQTQLVPGLIEECETALNK